MDRADLLSKHSSNPLEVPTSDPQNARYRKLYFNAQEMRGDDLSSEDPLGGYQVDMEEYHKHIAELYVKPSPESTPQVNCEAIGTKVEGEEDLYSDDELIISDGDEESTHMEEDTVIMEEDVDDTPYNEAEEETDEEKSILTKPQEEREEIEEEIRDLEEAVPQLLDDYKIVDRLGTGTFSSVYKAVDLGYHTKWHNATWLGRHPLDSSAAYQSASKPPGTKAMVAIKRIYVTSNPERIRNEIGIMEDCRGCRHVSQLITAFRQHDQVVAIMPYHRNEDYRDFYRSTSIHGIKSYIRCLLRALRDIHARGIIHRDVKPANFLFDPRTNTGTLCDFGLACRIDKNPAHSHCLHTAPSREFPHGRLKTTASVDTVRVKEMQRQARQKSGLPSDKVGYPEKDNRPQSKANRAGTRGFRAPEVLLKCNDQSGAIDIWAVGMIMLFFLVRKFPLFQSNDDIEATMEIASIIGRKRMERTATLHNRMFSTNVPSVTPDGISWREFVERQNPDILNLGSSSSTLREPSSPQSDSSLHIASPTEDSGQSLDAVDLESMFDLLDLLLQPDSIKRITARDALYHPFLREEHVEDDDFFPHPLGEGVCGHLHCRDEVTEEHRITGIGKEGNTEVRLLDAGQGIAIGRQPCEYHQYLASDSL